MEHIYSKERTSERGQSLILLALAFVTFLIVVGLAVDLGLVYVEKVRIGRAADAAALGAVPELPIEQAAFVRALMFLSDNGYDATNSAIFFNEEWQDWSLPENEADIILRIITVDYQELDEFDQPIPNTAQRLRVEGVRAVPMHFMKFANVFGFDFDSVDVTGSAVAENVQNLDVAVVFDRSGSMEFDTICYGCWETVEGQGYDYDNSQWSASNYPGGVRHPMPYPNPLCSGYDPEDMYYEDNYDNVYVIVEAEHYYNTQPPFDPDYRTSETSYWAVQRNEQGASSYGDNRGTYMQHNPFIVYPDETERVYDRSEVDQAPYLEYRFEVPQNGTYRLWLRGQGGNNDYSGNVNSREIHWKLNGTYRDSASNHSYFGFQYGEMYRGARANLWRWRQVDQFSLNSGSTYTLQIFAGGAGFRLDKIVITDASASRASRVLCNQSDCTNRSTDTSPDATAGLSGWACWECSPLFGPPSEGICMDYWSGSPIYQSMYDAMFDDKQPVRASKEAVKLFVEPPMDLDNRLDPQFDQVGLVSYSSLSDVDSELECLVRLGDSCLSFGAVFDAVEELDSDGATNMGAAMRDAVRVLSRDAGHYGRAGSRKFIILMTDGVPNVDPGGSCEDLWPFGGDAYDCVLDSAVEAARNGITIYTIGLGDGVDEPFLTAIAEETEGVYFPAPDKDDLDEIFLQILSRIYIRLVD